MPGLELTAEDLEGMTIRDRAAMDARGAWLKSAAEDKSRGTKQIPPDDIPWDQFIIVGGRGLGKSRSEVEWLWWECWRVPGIIGHAVGPAISDMMGTLFEGPAGFQACVPPECLRGGSWANAYNKTDHKLYLANGSLIRGFGATDGGSKLRGPQCHCAIGDELREWDKPAGMLEEAHSNLMFGVRLPYPDGTPARAMFGTTPKAIPYLLNLYKQKGVLVRRGSSYENLKNLSSSFQNQLFSKEGTKIGRVEIHAEDIDSEDGGIFQRSWFRLWPSDKKLPEFLFVLQSMDTAFEEEQFDKKKQEPDFSACSVLGIFNTKQCFTDAELRRMGVKSKYAAVLADFWMDRISYPELLEKARATYRMKWGAPGRIPDLVLIENKASGISLRQSMQEYSVPTWPFNPSGQSKTMRAHAASPLVLQGMLFVPESGRPDRKGMVRDWVEPLLQQMCAFKGEGSTQYDDGLDTIVQAMLYLSQQGFFHAAPLQTTSPDPDEIEAKDRAEARRIKNRENAGRSWYGA